MTMLSSITRRLATVTLHHHPSALSTVLGTSYSHVLRQLQALVGLRYKTGGGKNKKKSSKKPEKTASTDPTPEEEDRPNLLQQEWVELQKSIAVEGFDTGQITTATAIKKQRGGKQMRRKREKEAELAKTALDRERALSDLGGGQFPPLRYSDEETERLLALAYAAIPERGGKRGTRNLKRQKLRWFRVRKARAKQKRERIMAHERRMAKRSRIVREVMQVKEEAADIRARDKAYQEEVLKRWAENMTSASNESTDTVESKVVEEKPSI